MMKVLLIVVRGLHLGYVSSYGNEWIDTPAFDRLAVEGVVFDQHLADCPDAAAARRAWRTGRHQLPAMGAELAAVSPDLLELLRAHGVATVLVRDNSQPVDDEFAAGWDQVVDVLPETDEASPLEQTLAAVDTTLEQLAERDTWLLAVELATLLPPWTVPVDFRDLHFQPRTADEEAEAEPAEEEPLTPLLDPAVGLLNDPDDTLFQRLQRSYAGAVTFLDRGLEALLEDLTDRGLLDELLLIVTSDHGQALGEHGIIGLYRPWLHDELIHLPLVIRLPGTARAGQRTSALTQPADLMPTLLEAFGITAPIVHGRSWFPLLGGEDQPLRPYACSGLQRGEHSEYALRTREWGFILPLRTPLEEPRAPQLYVKPDDRWEVNNVLQHHLELAEHLEQVLRTFVAAAQRPGPLEPPPLLDWEGKAALARPSPEGDKA